MANIISLIRNKSDLFLVELDASYQNGILHFTHEISILVSLEDGKLKLIKGYEIGPEDSEYYPEDWDYLKERHCLSEESIINEINGLVNQKDNA